jgi:cytochrome c oxidase cbb3-type subunit 3
MSSDPTKNDIVHEVDGIEECDNKLPNWWLASLYVAIVFAVSYWYVYEQGHFAATPLAAYQEEVDRRASEEIAKAGPITAESLEKLTSDPAKVARGKEVFATTCAPCHRADAGGNVGPNLTDEYWLHGGAADKIFSTIAQGVPANGMPAWKAPLGLARVQAVTAYILTIKGTNVANGKAPQGNREELGALGP